MNDILIKDGAQKLYPFVTCIFFEEMISKLVIGISNHEKGFFGMAFTKAIENHSYVVLGLHSGHQKMVFISCNAMLPQHFFSCRTRQNRAVRNGFDVDGISLVEIIFYSR